MVYINDLTHINIKGRFTLFADDSTILWINKSANELEADIGGDLAKVKEWTDANSLSLNISKTNIITFKCSVGDITMGTQSVNRESENKFLGVYIDDKLRFEAHVLYLSKKLASNCYAIRVISRDLDLEIRKSAYFSLIESHLRYGICFWGSCPRYLFNILFVLQKRAIKSIFKLKIKDSSKPYFLSHRILTLPCLFLLETCCLIFRKFKDEINSVSVYNTRQKYSTNLPIPASSQVRGSIVYGGKKLFNHLPLRVRGMNSERKFRTEVKALLASKAYYSIDEFLNDVL